MSDRPRLLFVDDEPNFLHLLEVYFGWPGIAEVFKTGDPDEARRLASEHEFDFVFVDTVIPGVDGDRLGTELKNAARTATVVSLSGVPREAPWADVKLVKSNDVLEKVRELVCGSPDGTATY